MLTERFDRALQYAGSVHAGQKRKGTDVPYLSHLLAVASIVLESDGTEDEAIAALLHDAPEDQGGKPRLADIRARFGARVAEIVEACSDSLEEDPSKKDEVLGRKARYRDELRAHPDASVYLVSAPTSCTIPGPWPKTNEKVAQSFGRGSRPVRWSSYKICTPCSTSMKACTRSEWRA